MIGKICINCLKVLLLLFLACENYFIDKKFGACVVGEIIGVSLIWFVVTLAILPRRWIKTISMRIIFSIVLCFTIVSIYHIGKYHQATLEFTKNTKKMVQEVKSYVTNGGVIDNQQTEKIDLGMFGDIFRSLKELNVVVQKHFKPYEQFLEKINIEKALAATTLSDKNLRAQYTKNIQEAKQKLLILTKQYIKIIEEFKNRLPVDKIPAELKFSFEKGIQKGISASRINVDKFYELEFNILQGTLDLYSFLDKIEDNFLVEGNQLSFYKTEDVEQYNKLIGAIREFSVEQESLEKLYQDERMKKIKELESLANEVDGSIH